MVYISCIQLELNRSFSEILNSKFNLVYLIIFSFIYLFINFNDSLFFIGQQVALVGKHPFSSFITWSLILIYIGTSGCGKSTTIQLIERFYDANVGQLVRQFSFSFILLFCFFYSMLIQKIYEVWISNGIDHKVCIKSWLFSSFFIKENEYFLVGLVSQEPILFDMSIKENIAYGDTSRDDIPMEEIIEAAKNANIHDFIIQRLPNVNHRIRSFIERKWCFYLGIWNKLWCKRNSIIWWTKTKNW